MSLFYHKGHDCLNTEEDWLLFVSGSKDFSDTDIHVCTYPDIDVECAFILGHIFGVDKLAAFNKIIALP